MAKKCKKLPKNAKAGEQYTIPVKGRNGKRNVTFKRTKKRRFGKWQIVSNKPA